MNKIDRPSWLYSAMFTITFRANRHCSASELGERDMKLHRLHLGDASPSSRWLLDFTRTCHF